MSLLEVVSVRSLISYSFIWLFAPIPVIRISYCISNQYIILMLIHHFCQGYCRFVLASPSFPVQEGAEAAVERVSDLLASGDVLTLLDSGLVSEECAQEVTRSLSLYSEEQRKCLRVKR